MIGKTLSLHGYLLYNRFIAYSVIAKSVFWPRLTKHIMPMPKLNPNSSRFFVDSLISVKDATVLT
jgi:hypothetical protein